ncbi:MAG: dodecin family protein [Candidatus Ranarchaeia archaeon]|jgi:flavin-binding protein dodecin
MVIKIVELIGASSKSWADAVQNAISEATKTVRNVKGVDVVKMTCKVENSKIVEYRANCKVAFLIEVER